MFFARFIAVLRVTAAWIAGLSQMHWWRFLLWNAAGGIVWAMLVGLIAYFLGNKAARRSVVTACSRPAARSCSPAPAS